jgi:hypothetical protein
MLLVSGHSELPSPSTDIQPALKVSAISKPLSGLKDVVQKPHKAFQGFQ